MRLAAIVHAVLVIAYPVAVWFSLSHFSARTVGLLALTLVVPAMALRFRGAAREDLAAALRVPLVIVTLLLVGAILDDHRFFLVLPVVISLALLVTFGSTLRGEGPTLIERFARMQEGELDAGQVAHCRQVTWVWCGFFVVNAAIAAALAWLDWRTAWAVYTSAIAYALMGLLFAGEYIVRQVRFRRYGKGLHDRLLARLFPPREEGEGRAS